MRVAEAAQWQRGLRAGLAIGSALIVCNLLGIPFGYAAFGAYAPIVVDNGGPYRLRLQTMLLVVLGGATASLIGALLPVSLWITLPATAVICFAITFSRVLSQPIASTSVMILVLYFAGLGGTRHGDHEVLVGIGLFLAGGAWSILLSLLLWPVDPFRPARLAVGLCYETLAEMAVQLLQPAAHTPDKLNLDPYASRRQLRIRMEAARAALASTSARAPSRTALARQLTVLLETADMLLARMSRLAELQQLTPDAAHRSEEDRLAAWLRDAFRAIAAALAHHPADNASSFAVEGSHRLDLLTRHRDRMATTPSDDAAFALLYQEEMEALLELEVAFDAVRTVWTGAEPRQGPNAVTRSGTRSVSHKGDSTKDGDWLAGMLDALRTNWNPDSMMLRHALRITCVGCVDLLLLRMVHINHGYWLPVTSIIVLQPYGTGTLRKSVDRVVGTVAGAILAAITAALAQNEAVLITVIIVCATLAMASFAIDYAVFCFFLTPTFVLLSLPHLHNWQYAGVRIGTTLMGASVAVLAMRLLLPERAELEVSRLFLRGVTANAAYLRAMLRFWSSPSSEKQRVEQQVLAPARRACGLASNDAEEAVDRVMLEPTLGPLSGRNARSSAQLREQALASATYLRRLTQSITTLARVGDGDNVGGGVGGYQRWRVEGLLDRVERLGGSGGTVALQHTESIADLAKNAIAEQQLLRIERQVGVLEKAAQALL